MTGPLPVFTLHIRYMSTVRFLYFKKTLHLPLLLPLLLLLLLPPSPPPRLLLLIVVFEANSDGYMTKRRLAARLASEHSNHGTILLWQRSSPQSPLNRTIANSFKRTIVFNTAVLWVNMIFLLAVETNYFPARIVLRPGHVTTWLGQLPPCSTGRCTHVRFQ